ncbi:mitotic checkpoint protein-domain-containing protein [Lactarius indigo]|nr:mitotic checkpoint protein-domain-containing protein [Lactarius indigo]
MDHVDILEDQGPIRELMGVYLLNSATITPSQTLAYACKELTQDEETQYLVPYKQSEHRPSMLICECVFKTPGAVLCVTFTSILHLNRAGFEMFFFTSQALCFPRFGLKKSPGRRTRSSGPSAWAWQVDLVPCENTQEYLNVSLALSAELNQHANLSGMHQCASTLLRVSGPDIGVSLVGFCTSPHPLRTAIMETHMGRCTPWQLSWDILEAEVQAARAEREAWCILIFPPTLHFLDPLTRTRAAHTAPPETPAATPVSITQSLSALRLEHAHLLQEHGADRAALRQREAELADVQAREVDARATADALLQETRAAQDRATRAERAAALAEREIGFLQALNASYASEEAAQGTGHIDQAKEQHVRELEALVGEYKAHMHALETEIQELAKRPALNQGTGLQALRDELANEKHALQEARRALEEKEEEAEKDREKIEELEQTLFDLRGEIGAGRHVPPGAALDRLKSENAALLQRLSALDHHVPTNPNNTDTNGEEQLVPRASWAAVCEEKAQLEAELKQRDKRMLRLRQVFAGKTAEFCEALSAILGVKLAFYDNGQVRVTSQYDLGAAFVFQPARKDGGGGGARMQLVAQGEGGPQELPQLMRNWVEIEQSIPCFLASVTLECYDKRKREQQMGGGE